MKKNGIESSKTSNIIPDGYKKLLEDLKLRIRSSQVKAIVKVNEELIKLYWEIGREITERQENEGLRNSNYRTIG